jgi:hypothetical protein
MLPDVRFWVPTRAWQPPSGLLPVFDPLLNWLRKLASLPNVTVRPSALNFGDSAPMAAGLHAGFTEENAEAFHCPAPLQGNECRECRACRACWEAKDVPGSYRKH